MERVPLVLFLVVALAKGVSSIGCFVCSSFNGSEPSCEDPYNSTYAMLQPGSSSEVPPSHYHHPCWAFKKERNGLFPADHCIKIKGHRTDDHTQTMVLRTCAVDSGTLTADTEIVRISHCGHFKYEGHYYAGCVQSCDSDGCNASRPRLRLPFPLIFLILIVTVIVPLT